MREGALKRMPASHRAAGRGQPLKPVDAQAGQGVAGAVEDEGDLKEAGGNLTVLLVAQDPEKELSEADQGPDRQEMPVPYSNVQDKKRFASVSHPEE